MPPEHTFKATVEEEARSTVDKFRSAVDNDGSLSQAFKEIDKDRQSFGIGSEKEKAYTENVHWKLIKEHLLPEVSLKYASEHFDQLATDERITNQSFKDYRVAGYDDMTSIEKSMNHYLMDHYDEIKEETTPGWGTCVSMDDINMALKQAKDARTGTRGEDPQPTPQDQPQQTVDPMAHETIACLTAHGGALEQKLFDRTVSGITKDSLRHALEYDDQNWSFLNGRERQTTFRMLQNFDDISRGREVIRPVDLKYYARKNHENTSGLSLDTPMKIEGEPIKPFNYKDGDNY